MGKNHNQGLNSDSIFLKAPAQHVVVLSAGLALAGSIAIEPWCILLATKKT